jgi:hypothetical protein
VSVRFVRQAIADALFVIGNQHLQAGRARVAQRRLAMAAQLASTNARYFGAAAGAAAAAGDMDATVRYAERALHLDGRLDAVRELLSGLFLNGENYIEVLGRIHRYLRPRTYLEVGVETGLSMRLAGPRPRAIGIDPDPKLSEPLGPNVRFFQETSDAFFARHDVRAELGGLPVDLAFIDGLHLFDYALRDFMNVERWCAPESTVIIDDCFPMDRRTAERNRTTAFWTGDVWKLVVLLKKYRPALSIHTVATPPTGMCIVRNLDPGSTFIRDNLDRLVAEFMALDYSFLEKDRGGKLNLFANNWTRIQSILGSPRQL